MIIIRNDWWESTYKPPDRQLQAYNVPPAGGFAAALKLGLKAFVVILAAECIYTAQKQKKNKSWRDGICTCCFVRGWIILKLFPEGASITSEPLEVWRLTPDTPEAVARLEIELQVHLVQLLGNPQPLRGQKQPQRQPQPQSVEFEGKATGLQSNTSLSSSASQSVASVDRVKVPLKRRLAGGLPRPNGISPQGFRRPAAASPHAVCFDPSAPSESGWKDLESAQPQGRRSAGGCPAFIPPLRGPVEEIPTAQETLPFEKAWAINGAKALLSSICVCCGNLECHHCVGQDARLAASSGVTELFLRLFNEIQAGDLLQGQQLDRKVDTFPPMNGGICIPSDEQDNLGRDTPYEEHDTSPEPSPAAATAPSWRDVQAQATNSNAGLQYGEPLAVAAEASASGKGENTHKQPQGFGAVPTTTARSGGGTAFSVSSHAPSSISAEGRSRFFALAGGCLPQAHSGIQAAADRNGLSGVQSGASLIASRTTGAQGQGTAHVRGISKPPGPAPPMGSSEAGSRSNCARQTIMKPELQHQLQAQQRQQGKLQQVSLEAGVAGRDRELQAPPLLLAEELPEGQLENLVDVVPVTFCTAPTETPPFNAAYAAARHLFVSSSLEGEGLRANQLALRYFNSILVSLQAALTETAQNISWSTGSSPGMGEARFLVEGACIRLDGKHHSGFQQRVAEAQRLRKAKQQQLRRSHQLRQRKKRRIESGKTISSASESEDQEDTPESSECETDVPRQPGLLLDLSKASILPGPPKPGLEGHHVQNRSAIPFEKAASIKEHLGRNDIWAFSTDEHFEDWSRIVLARSMWRGASPHTSCIKVSVLGPWPAAVNALRIPLIRFAANGQFTRASLPAPPPLLLQIRQLLQGRCRAIGGVKAAEKALNTLTTSPELSLKCLEAALEVGKACVARAIGLGYHEGGVKGGLDVDAAITQLITLDITSEDAEAVVCKCSNSGGNWMLNEEQQRVLIGISRWFVYTDGRRPFGVQDGKQLHEERQEDTERCEDKNDRNQNSQELQQREASIFSQDNLHSTLQPISQVNPLNRQEKEGDPSSCSTGAQACIAGSTAIVSHDDDDIADICLSAEDLDELQLHEDNCSEVGVSNSNGGLPVEGSALPLDHVGEATKDGDHDQDSHTPAASTILLKTWMSCSCTKTTAQRQDYYASSLPGDPLQAPRSSEEPQPCAAGRLSEMQPTLLPYAICSSAARNTAVHEFKYVLSGLLAAPGARTTLATMARELLKNIDDGSFPPSMQVRQPTYNISFEGQAMEAPAYLGNNMQLLCKQ
ncbi:hypothetical protein, conserved [Eimeria praecox]|uniref:Uncharacterized protein n=1 Tax=Eimeria praecox TaxID=51316 RepID=U6G3A0_9EIME|nr:hypothetical protein, conserved [Eimeria praecox]